VQYTVRTATHVCKNSVCGIFCAFFAIAALFPVYRRYVETAFNIFDVTGDGEVEAKVCCLHFVAQNMEICQNFAALAREMKKTVN
jgi:hypothetical protein